MYNNTYNRTWIRDSVIHAHMHMQKGIVIPRRNHFGWGQSLWSPALLPHPPSGRRWRAFTRDTPCCGVLLWSGEGAAQALWWSPVQLYIILILVCTALDWFAFINNVATSLYNIVINIIEHLHTYIHTHIASVTVRCRPALSQVPLSMSTLLLHRAEWS